MSATVFFASSTWIFDIIICWNHRTLLGGMEIDVAIEAVMSDGLGFHPTCLCTAVSLWGGAVVQERLRFVPFAPLHHRALHTPACTMTQ